MFDHLQPQTVDLIGNKKVKMPSKPYTESSSGKFGYSLKALYSKPFAIAD